MVLFLKEINHIPVNNFLKLILGGMIQCQTYIVEFLTKNFCNRSDYLELLGKSELELNLNPNWDKRRIIPSGRSP